MPNTAAEAIVATSQTQKTVHVAVGVIVRNGRVLIARRPDSAHQGGLLEFPGGKVESGESVQQALCREIAEETGLVLSEDALEPVIGIRHDYGDKCVFLDVWLSRSARGEPEGKEGQPVGWFEPDALRDEDFPAANRPIIRALQLPRQLAITGDIPDAIKGLERLERALVGRSEGSLVVLRAPHLDQPQYRWLATEAVRLCRDAGVGLIVHGAETLCEEVDGARGLQVPWRVASQLTERPVGADLWFGVSCHTSEQLRHAERLGADYVLLGNVLETLSHPGQPGMGWERFRALAADAKVPVYAIGGLGPEQEPEVTARGGQGVAGIRFWW
ncbi:Nudix family hydrolase [Marinobacter daepoensis]|uniref:8-oxo-dGTP diphosphatase n=1 Tax=Marinobacter daepoensis TaxID=262077 RepID=A0ABS3BJ39_9GAMM|nr:Nudix family hydrolase [Marinobacter daepoensis]MBN7771581.1 Nudix family hydrolase [Marinobacter daepoensis]MBY6034152.1 Nudix family hydrolase [Marinobacter daepoensis]MBY6080181.1 Nudix family hydrolase [Marinobacter daepoensis]